MRMVVTELQQDNFRLRRIALNGRLATSWFRYVHHARIRSHVLDRTLRRESETNHVCHGHKRFWVELSIVKTISSSWSQPRYFSSCSAFDIARLLSFSQIFWSNRAKCILRSIYGYLLLVLNVSSSCRRRLLISVEAGLPTS